MNIFASCALTVLHAAYSLWTLATYCAWRTFTNSSRPLRGPRRQVPKHLALILVAARDDFTQKDEENDICRTVVDVVNWCKSVEIESLSVYNREGIPEECIDKIQEMLDSQSLLDMEQDGDSDAEFPLTPPPSDHTISRPLSRSDCRTPDEPITILPFSRQKAGARRNFSSRRQAFQLKILSHTASKPLMAQVARSLAHTAVQDMNSRIPAIDVETVNSGLLGHNLDAPDFMIIHDISQPAKAALELEGFPPWLIRLTEIHKTPRDIDPSLFSWFRAKPNRTTGASLTEADFRRALDEYALAEMRLGK